MCRRKPASKIITRLGKTSTAECSSHFRVRGGKKLIHVEQFPVYKPSIFLQRVEPPTFATAAAIKASLAGQKEPRVLVKFH